jgi:hypothetical protein
MDAELMLFDFMNTNGSNTALNTAGKKNTPEIPI